MSSINWGGFSNGVQNSLQNIGQIPQNIANLKSRNIQNRLNKMKAESAVKSRERTENLRGFLSSSSKKYEASRDKKELNDNLDTAILKYPEMSDTINNVRAALDSASKREVKDELSSIQNSIIETMKNDDYASNKEAQASVAQAWKLYEAVKADYDLVRKTLLDPSKGFSSLTGKMGVYIQPRTKGQGHGSTSRAFYARPKFLAEFIKL